MSLTERLAIVITGNAVSAVNAFKQVEAASEQATAKLSIGKRATSALDEAFGGHGSKAVAAGGALAAAAAVDRFVNAFAGATAQVRAFQRVSGASAEDASKLVASFKVLGIDSDAAGKALFRLAHNLDGNKDALAQYGVQVATAKDGTVDLTNTMLNVADAVAKVGPGAQADAIAFAAFGRQATALLPVLLRGREGLKELYDAAARHGEVFHQDDLDKGKEFTLATRELGQAIHGLEIQLGKGLVPALTDATKALEGFIDTANKATSPIGGIGAAIDSVAKAGAGFLPIRAILDAVHGDFGKIAGDLPFLGTGIELVHGKFRRALGTIIPLLGEHKKANKDAKDATDALGDASGNAADKIQDEKTALAEAKKAVDEWVKATQGVATAHDALDKASRSVITASRDEDRAREDLNKLLRQGRVDADAVAQAEKGVASSAKATADAQKAEAAATERVADAQQAVLDAQVAIEKVKQGASASDIEKARLAVGRAQRDQQRAINAVADAQDKANNLITIGIVGAGQQVGTTRDVLDAQFDLADALDNVQLSALAAHDAQDALKQVENQGKEGSKELKDAQDELARKQKDLNQAIEDQATAHENVIAQQGAQIEAAKALAKAQEGDLDFDEKLRDAQQKIADAHQNTADQIKAEKDAIDALIQANKDLLAAQQAAATTPGANLQTSAITDQDFRPVSRSAGATTNTTVVNVHLDGRQIAQVTQDQLAASARRNGLS